MENTNWQISGDYFETCSCDLLCPCITTNLTGEPTKGHCNFAMVFRIDKGSYGDQTLDGLSFALAGHTPGVMAEGNWSVGLILDKRVTEAQQEALTTIVSGQVGGPPAAVAPLIGNFLGVEVKPFHYQEDGLSWSVSIPGVLEQSAEGIAGADPDKPLYIDNTVHPANARLALAKATGSHMHVFNLDWDDDSGRNNGHFAPFSWQAA